MLDEFALSLYMKDVYWADQGRTSVDAVLIALMVGGLFVIGTSPLELEDATDGSRLGLALALAVNCIFAAAALLKGKLVTGAVGIFVPGGRHRGGDAPRQAQVALGARALHEAPGQDGARRGPLRPRSTRPA